MRIAFYWDIFWLLNFIMNLFLLGMTAIIRRKYLRKWRLIGVSLLESGQMTAVLVWWLQQLKEHNGKNEILFWQNGMPAGLIVLEILFAFEMLQFCFWEKQFRELLKDLLYFLQVSVLTGGALLLCREWMGKEHTTGIWTLFAGTAGIWLVFYIMERYLRQGDKRVNTMDGVIIMGNGRRYPLRVMLDTGNCLVSPYSGERVMIIGETLAQQLEITKTRPPLLIPFQSIGGDGMLTAYRIPRLSLQDGSEVRNFLAAVSPKLSEDSAVQLIMYGRK
ncbi:sigma-E processing peptidase SpoIIGA [Jutongia huaianensis]|jgi:sigma-E processing peptidase SpoIIGA|uniref:Sigma-E processing peptidase SpoIIGA n=1 Tax=Jutongia huaianensis TaxID=2763668 RepID=A0ABR7N391_9FIRM|nr:sigma-E processing peptidase SpoIIGA [Jutongia huaianensis]MBC8563089.1 sigma-E processing peptidase SpoIIGA [Jutongia huaianensis]